jgi:hypothetical protein
MISALLTSCRCSVQREQKLAVNNRANEVELGSGRNLSAVDGDLDPVQVPTVAGHQELRFFTVESKAVPFCPGCEQSCLFVEGFYDLCHRSAYCGDVGIVRVAAGKKVQCAADVFGRTQNTFPIFQSIRVISASIEGIYI